MRRNAKERQQKQEKGTEEAKRRDWHVDCSGKCRQGSDDPSTDTPEEDINVLRWALAFLIFALIAALFGFSGLAHTGAWVAQVLAFIFVVLFLISLIFGSLRGTPPPP